MDVRLDQPSRSTRQTIFVFLEKPRVRKGLQRVLTYYLIGFIAALIIHLLTGSDNRVLMPKSYLVIILSGTAALPWTFLNICNLVYAKKRLQNFVELCTHAAFIFIIFFVADNVW